MGKEYLYDIGDVVGKGTLRVVEKTRDSKYNRKSYIVQSLKYSNYKNNYMMSEGDVVNGKTDGYLTCRRICEENSLWSIKRIRQNIIDIEQAKTIAPRAGKSVLFKCENKNCKNTKIMRPAELCNRGFSCSVCSKGTSYPELYFMAYNDVKDAGFEDQQRFNDFEGHIFDFVNYERSIIVETHGIAHYKEVGDDTSWKDVHKKSKASDERKRKYCKDNGWTLIELDCRYSTFEHIRNSIANEPLLKDIIDKDVEKIVRFIERNKRYPVKEIIRLYTKELKTTVEIANDLNVHHGTIGNILKRNNIKLRFAGEAKKKVKCIETGVTYDSGYHAMKMTGINNKSISNVCNPNKPNKTAGGYHWEFTKE